VNVVETVKDGNKLFGCPISKFWQGKKRKINWKRRHAFFCAKTCPVSINMAATITDDSKVVFKHNILSKIRKGFFEKAKINFR